MRVIGWEIEHFQGLRGLRHSLQLPSSGGITVIHGPNEAGKSTLLRFIHAMLFGSDSVARRPTVGAGSLMVESGGVRYRVKRDFSRRGAASMTDETGTEIDVRELQTMLAGMDQKVFKAIFAFGLSELQTFESLTGDGVQERIFAAGVAGAGGSARTAITTLKATTDGLLRQRALDATLNALGVKLTGVIQAQKRGLEQAARYSHLLERETTLTVQLDQQAVDMLLIERELRRLEIVQGIWPAWSNGQSVRTELDALPTVPSVPREALRFPRESHSLEQQLATQQLEAEEQLIAADERATALRTQINPQLVAAGARIKSLADQRAVYLDRQAQMAKLGVELHEHQQLFELQVALLGSDWDEARVVRFNADAATIGDVRNFDQSLTRVTQAVTVASADAMNSRAQWQTARDATGRFKLEMREHDAAFVEQHDVIQGLAITLASQRSALEHRSEMQAALAALAPKLDIERRAIGSAWTDERLLATSFSRAITQELQGFHVRLTTDQTDLKRAEEYVRELSPQCDEAQRRAHQAQGEDGQKIPRRLKEIDQLEELEVRLRGRFAQRTELTARADRLRRDQAELQSVGNRKNASRRPSMDWLVWVSAIAGCALAVWFATVALYIPAGLMLVVVGLPLLAIHLRSGAVPSGASGAQGNGLNSDIGRMKHEFNVNATEIQSDLQTLQLPKEASTSDLDVYRLSLSRERQGFSLHLRELRELLETERALKARLDDAHNHLREVGERAAQAQIAWQEWCTTLGLPASSHPSVVGELIRDIETAALTLRSAEGFQASLTQVNAEVTAWERNVLSVVERFGSPTVRGRDLVESLATLIAQSQAARERHQRLAVAELAERQALEQAQRNDAQAKQAQAEKQVYDLTWKAWIAERDCPAHDPENAMPIIKKIEQLQRTVALKRSAQQTISNLLELTDHFENEVTSLNLAFGLCSGDFQVARVIEDYVVQFEQHKAQSIALSALEEQQQSLRATISTTAKRVSSVREEVKSLCAKWNAADVDDLERYVVVNERRVALEEILKQIQSELERHAGSDLPTVETLLSQADPLSWDQQLTATRTRVAEQQTTQTELLEARALTRSDCERMATNMDLARLGLEREQIQAQLRQHTRRWLQASLAHDLLAGTLAEYERTKGPEVFRHASALFRTVTADRYQHVKAVEGRTALRVLTATAEASDAAQLSRGTQEQLYLAVRLGLARAHGERTARLPIVMDDVLVNADPERARAVIAVLAEVAAHHQVIYLTCHRMTVDLFQSVYEAVNVIEMPRLEPTAVLLDASSESTGHGHQPRLDLTSTLKERTLKMLQTRGDWVTSLELKPSLGVGSSVSDGEYQRLMTALEADGQIIQDGEKRLRRYRMACSESPIVV